MENKTMDIDIKIAKTDKMIRKVRQVRAAVKMAMKQMDNQYAYTTSTILRGNVFGDLIRKKRTDKLNSSINKVQQAMLRLEADLLLYDESLARSLRLPAKMADPARVNGKVDDITLRSRMRYREFDVAKSLRNLEKILDRLEDDKKELRFIKKDQKGLI
ncbi:hypothetical protein [uncultured Anaerococcus sp.]|uniref:hypothetical protein n=1 Tax=uncultured Anaerococcus sp. TaxID=293428 RepID=UPI00260818C3|nr:hypothetical protein [uncultured Anaerococcus sp.]